MELDERLQSMHRKMAIIFVNSPKRRSTTLCSQLGTHGQLQTNSHLLPHSHASSQLLFTAMVAIITHSLTEKNTKRMKKHKQVYNLDVRTHENLQPGNSDTIPQFIINTSPKQAANFMSLFSERSGICTTTSHSAFLRASAVSSS
jgi:hypothetical protein